jgi:predicted transcriptional regulator
MRRSAETPLRLMNDFAPLEQIRYDCVVTPAKALEKQIELYRQMSGEQRLKVALDLHEMSCNIARAGIRRQNPNANEAKIERLLRRRIELARAIREGEEQANRGEVVPHEQVKREFASWISNK